MEARFQKWLRKLPRRYEKYRQPKGLWSMTIARELAFCESYARECFSGVGRMIDLGCWFGATTFSLARGLARNRRVKNNRVIEAFDLFIWNGWMLPEAHKIKMPLLYQEGESFYPDVQKLLEPYNEFVRLHQQDLMEYRAEVEPVELLFIDAMKTWPLARKIASDFFPRLIPDASVVVQQDFIFHQPIAATNHLLMWQLRDHFELLHQIPRSGSIAFLCTKQITADEMPAMDPQSFSLEEIDQAYEYSRACIAEDDLRPHLDATKLLFLIERGDYRAALEHTRRLVNNRIKFCEHVLADALRVIDQAKTTMARTNEPESRNQIETLAKIRSLLASL